MPGRIVDLSSNNPHPIDFAAVKAAGVSTVIVKATEGTGYTNPFYASDMADAQAAGLDTMGYHFAGWGNVAAEVAHFKSVAGEKGRCLDIETSTNIGWTRAFLTDLGLPANECVTYGSASSLSQIANTIPSYTWVAAYGQSKPNVAKMVMWQFTSSATDTGIGGLVDESHWYGTEGQYEALFAPPQPIITQEDEHMDSVVAPNGDIVSHYRTPQNHLLEVTRKAGDQGNGTTGLEVIDITAAYPQFQVAS